MRLSRLSPLLAAAALAIPACGCTQPATSDASAASGQAAASYMASVSAQPGVKTTSSGLAYKIEQSGPVTGPHPRLGDQVRVSYAGKLPNGTQFDSSDANGGPMVMTVGQLVPGWNEALQMMRPGDDWTLYVPPSLGYGDQAAGPIPANSVMVFRLKLLDVLPSQ